MHVTCLYILYAWPTIFSSGENMYKFCKYLYEIMKQLIFR